MQKILENTPVGTVRLRKVAGVRRLSMVVNRRGEVTVTMPYYVPFSYGVDFLQSRMEWVKAAQEKARSRMVNEYVPDASVVEDLRRRAKAELPPRLAELAAQHGFHYNSVRIKHNSSNWGSCSSKGNINLNLNLVRLPAEMRDYVILHELCHLRYHNHGPEFHALLESVCPGHRELSKRLRSYRLI